LVLTGHTGEQIFEWLRCKGGESIAQPKHLATAATQSGALFLVLKAECIAMCAPMWHGTQWVYHQPLHLICSVQGLLPRSPSASPSPGSTPGRSIPFPDCLLLFSRLGCPGSMPGEGIMFPGCLLLFRELSCPGSTPDRSIMFPSCLLLFSELSCPGSTPGRGILFPGCLLLFSELNCLGSTPGKGILFPGCLLLFSELSCPGSTPGRGIPLPGWVLLFSELNCPSSTPGRGILFPGCLPLFSGLSCPGSAPGGNIHLPGCINAKSLPIPLNTYIFVLTMWQIPFVSCMFLWSKYVSLILINQDSKPDWYALF
jgi:hypothetical protein